MFEINDRIRIPEEEFRWTFVRSGGPGGQNVNKVASKAVLHWDLAASVSLPEEVKSRLRTLYRNRINVEGELIVNSQRYRDQDRNRADCLDKLREMILQAAVTPRKRKLSRPTRGSRERRLSAKRRRATTKATRRLPVDD